MRPQGLVAWAVVAVGLAGLAWWQLERRSEGDVPAAGLAVPGFAARVEAVDRIEVRGAGDALLVAIEKTEGQWRMPDRLGWPANQREVSRALFRLAEAKRIEAKTADPKRHVRLGVEAIGDAAAKGSELRLSGGGEPVRITVGNNHPGLGGSYVRFGDEAQAWLLDEDIAPARNPADWLDRRLLDIPLARIAEVRVTPAQGRAFRLTRSDDDRFGLDGQPAQALGNPDDGNATAGFTDQLPLDDLATDSGAGASQTVEFETVDGLRISVAAWRDERGTWARLSASLDEDRAREWFTAAAVAEAAARAEAERADAEAAGEGDEPVAAESAATPDPEARVAELRRQVGEWRTRFDGKQFLLPAYKAANLMKSREDYLAGTP